MTYNNSARHRERGVALLITMLSVMLLSVIVLGMMVSTNTETNITSNFRDKQKATFSAMAGLQEARDRIQPATANIIAPVDAPQLGAQNIVYIINPKSGETVAPWDFITPNNPYKDTELCHEGVLGLTGTAGVPCTTIASGTWYRTPVVDNSLPASAPWNLTTPLDVKWIRISLKTNNMTPIAVNGDAASGVVVCWNGSHQITQPAGYGPDCKPDGSVASILLKNPGTGYVTNPTVTLSAPPAGGIQAVASAITALTPSGIVQSATLISGGSGYTSAPTVTLTGDGTGATATATFLAAAGAPVASVNLTSAGGQCYSSPPGVIFTGGGGSGAVATAALASTPSCIQGWNVIGSCHARRGSTVSGVGVTGGGGTGFSGTITFKPGTGAVVSVSLQDPGTGYTSLPLTSPVVFPSGVGCPGLTVSANLGYLAQSVSVTNGGSSYTSPPTVTLANGAGTSATPASATATLGVPPPNAGQVTGINIVSGGSGYSTAPLVTFTGGGGAGAAATTTLGTSLTITGFNISNPGKGYLGDPSVTLSAPTLPGGIQAVAKATLGRGANYGKIYNLTSLAVTKNGSRTMMQMEATTPVSGFPALGALTIDGPADPSILFPNSNPFVVHGADANSCGETPEPDHPAIAAYDSVVSPTNVSSIDTIINALPRPDHYTGSGGTPSVVDVFGGMGETMGTPAGLFDYLQNAQSKATTQYTSNPSLTTFDYGSAGSPVVNYVNGDLTVNGNHTGYGTLVVTGKLTFGGNFNWYGPVLVVGDGVVEFTGGGNGKIIGTLLAAKIWDNYTDQNLLQSNGSPSFTWHGGGGNGVLYDHCWATNLLNDLDYDAPPTTQPLKVLSLRTLAY
jgi:hypothetical protein